MKVFTEPTQNIIIPPDRVRKIFDKKGLEELAQSIKTIGQVQNGVCFRNKDGAFVLVAGERRLRACEIAQVPFSFVLREDSSELEILMIELEENLRRENLTWQEEVLGLERLMEVKKKLALKTGEKVGLAALSKELDLSIGKLSEDLTLAKFTQALPEVAACSTKKEAKKMVDRLVQMVKRQESLEKAISEAESKEKIRFTVSDGADGSAGAISSDEDKKLLFYKDKILRGKMEDRLTELPDEHFQIVIFDPPWGVNYSNVSRDRRPQGFDDSPEAFDENILPWLSLIFTKMAPQSHLYLFFPITRHKQVYDAIESLGFNTNRIPLIWYKSGAHVTRNPEIWPGRSYEPIAYARKGDKPLVIRGAPDLIVTPVPAPRIKRDHPTAKHPQIMKDLIARSAGPGDRILDPMCGSGMTGVAADVLRPSLGLDFVLIEENTFFCDLALTNLILGYSSIVQETFKEEPEPPKPVPLDSALPEDIPSDFKTLQPGTREWKLYWKAHPEEQEDMLQWKMEEDL